MNIKDTILEDLQIDTPISPMIDPPMYNETDSPLQKVKTLDRQRRRAKSLKDRVGELLAVYYIGQVIMSTEGQPERSQCAGFLSQYFKFVSLRTYHLFELLGPEQIARTRSCRITMIYDLKDPDFLELVDVAASIAGARI